MALGVVEQVQPPKDLPLNQEQTHYMVPLTMDLRGTFPCCRSYNGAGGGGAGGVGQDATNSNPGGNGGNGGAGRALLLHMDQQIL